MTTCIHCPNPVGSHPRAALTPNPLSCGSPECDVFARGYQAAEGEVLAFLRAYGVDERYSEALEEIERGVHRRTK